MALREAVIVTAATVLPISVDEVKLYIKLDTDEDDGTIAGMIPAAARHFELETGRTLQLTGYEYYPETWPDDSDEPIRLPQAAPLVSVTGIYYKGTDGVEITWPTDQWVWSARTSPGRVMPAYGYQYPSQQLYPLDPIRIAYTAGLSTATNTAAVKTCLLEMIASLYVNRESVVVTDRSSIAQFSENPVTKRLIDFHKVEHFIC